VGGEHIGSNHPWRNNRGSGGWNTLRQMTPEQRSRLKRRYWALSRLAELGHITTSELQELDRLRAPYKRLQSIERTEKLNG
jgi:hypothetical protein